MPPARYTPTAAVLFDADCGFCRWSVAKLLAWDQHGNLRPVAIQSEEGRRLLSGMSEEERMASWHLVVDGRRYSAGQAFPPMLRLLPGGRAPARLADSLPALTERGYGLAARQRGRLGRLIPSGARRRADRRIERRTARRPSGPPTPAA